MFWWRLTMTVLVLCLHHTDTIFKPHWRYTYALPTPRQHCTGAMLAPHWHQNDAEKRYWGPWSRLKLKTMEEAEAVWGWKNNLHKRITPFSLHIDGNSLHILSGFITNLGCSCSVLIFSTITSIFRYQVPFCPWQNRFTTWVAAHKDFNTYPCGSRWKNSHRKEFGWGNRKLK